VTSLVGARRVSPAGKAYASPQAPQIAVPSCFRHDCGHKNNTGAPFALPINEQETK